MEARVCILCKEKAYNRIKKVIEDNEHCPTPQYLQNDDDYYILWDQWIDWRYKDDYVVDIMDELYDLELKYHQSEDPMYQYHFVKYGERDDEIYQINCGWLYLCTIRTFDIPSTATKTE